MLCDKHEYTVGRSSCDISLPNDVSISRIHAKIIVSSDEIFVEDNSKYGTFVNNAIQTNIREPIGQHIKLRVGQTVRFGRLENVWRLEQIKINCCSSTLSGDDVSQLKDYLRIVNGKLHQNWTENCTHLVMNDVTFTIKGKLC